MLLIWVTIFINFWLTPYNLIRSIGPKLYIATPDFHLIGSTPLHKDICGAVNVLAHASQRSEDGCDAVWHIFFAKDYPIIREYLISLDETHRAALGDMSPRHPGWNPVHAQNFFLDEARLVDLKAMGVVPFTIYQRHGDAVFIPAGCCHQVGRSFASLRLLKPLVGQ